MKASSWQLGERNSIFCRRMQIPLFRHVQTCCCG